MGYGAPIHHLDGSGDYVPRSVRDNPEGSEAGPRTAAPGAAHDSTPKGLNSLASEIHFNAVNHGWWNTREIEVNGAGIGVDEERNFGEVLMLIVSEASEALESWRDGDPVNVLFMQHKDGPRCRTDARCRSPKGTSDPDLKPEGVPSEMADIIIRVLDACGAWGIDIEEAVKSKMDYNRTRPYLHGRTH